MSKILSISGVLQYIQKVKDERKSIILVGGCFDILHAGHIEFLSRASKLADILLVQLESDDSVRDKKGDDRPIHSQKDRARTLSGINGVDAVILLPKFERNEDYFELVKQVRPDIIGITRGESDSYVTPQAKAVGAKVVEVMDRLEGYSTTDVIKRVRK